MSDETTPDPPPLLGRDQTVPRRRWKWLLPLMVTVAAGSLIAVGVGWAVRDRDPSPQQVMDRYLDLIEKGDTVQAYGLLCDRFRRERPFSEFQSILTIEKREAGGVTDHQIGPVTEYRGGSRVVAYTVRRGDGDLVLEALLVRERDNWRVCAIQTRGKASTTTSLA